MLVVFDTKRSLITLAKYGQESYQEFQKMSRVTEKKNFRTATGRERGEVLTQRAQKMIQGHVRAQVNLQETFFF